MATPVGKNILGRRIPRTVLAVLGGYSANAVFVGVTEQLLSKLGSKSAYFWADLASQCVYGVISACLCCLIAGQGVRLAASIVLNGLGLMVGAISVIASWKVAPHWYSLSLLSIWTPCVWVGYLSVRQVTAAAFLPLKAKSSMAKHSD